MSYSFSGNPKVVNMQPVVADDQAAIREGLEILAAELRKEIGADGRRALRMILGGLAAIRQSQVMKTAAFIPPSGNGLSVPEMQASFSTLVMLRDALAPKEGEKPRHLV